MSGARDPEHAMYSMSAGAARCPGGVGRFADGVISLGDCELMGLELMDMSHV